MGVNYKRLLRDKDIIRTMVEKKVDTMMKNDKDKVRRSLVDPHYNRSKYCLCKTDQDAL